MLHARTSIALIQANVTSTRFDYGKPYALKARYAYGSNIKTNMEQSFGILILMTFVVKYLVIWINYLKFYSMQCKFQSWSYAWTSSTTTRFMPNSTITFEAWRQQTLAWKHKHILLPKLYKQTFQVCGDHNMLTNNEHTKECTNCGDLIVRGETQSGSIEMDGLLVGKMVEFFNEDTSNWKLEQLVN